MSGRIGRDRIYELEPADTQTEGHDVTDWTRESRQTVDDRMFFFFVVVGGLVCSFLESLLSAGEARGGSGEVVGIHDDVAPGIDANGSLIIDFVIAIDG